MTFSPVDEAIAQITVLRLHTDTNGFVWYGDDDQLAVNSFLEADDFIQSDIFQEYLKTACCTRMLGNHANAALIVKLQQQRRRHPIRHQKIQLTSPAIISTLAARQHPETVLHHLWQPGSSSCLPRSWHNMNENDYCTYAMINEGCGCDDAPLGEVVKRIVAYHPAWPALSFINSLSMTYACKLICEIVDPRWYVHPDHAFRPSRLFAYLGLTPQNAQAYTGTGLPATNYSRFVLAVRTWYDRAGASNTPSGFLWRMFAAKGEGAEALLRCTQKLVHLIQTVWLYTVIPPHQEVGFVPQLFFPDAIDAEAFKAHLINWKPVAK
jgi:hypothetical protein